MNLLIKLQNQNKTQNQIDMRQRLTFNLKYEY